MTAPATWTWARGQLAVLGYAPDGDSVRFLPDDPATLRRLTDGDRLEVSERDGTVQLRLDAIDAPESHYQGQAQPLADPARDDLLAAAGFTGLRYSTDGEGTVEATTPERVPAAIAASLVETNGRPVALLFVGDAATSYPDGTAVTVDEALFDRSLNAAQTRIGRVYLTLYTSTPEAARTRFIALAREAGAGTPAPLAGTVWAADRSAGFRVTTQADVGPQGSLVLPKLFRRVTDYLASESTETFDAWLLDQGADDDPVEAMGQRTTLSALVTQSGDQVSLTVSPLDLVFVE